MQRKPCWLWTFTIFTLFGSDFTLFGYSLGYRDNKIFLSLLLDSTFLTFSQFEVISLHKLLLWRLWFCSQRLSRSSTFSKSSKNYFDIRCSIYFVVVVSIFDFTENWILFHNTIKIPSLFVMYSSEFHNKIFLCLLAILCWYRKS